MIAGVQWRRYLPCHEVAGAAFGTGVESIWFMMTLLEPDITHPKVISQSDYCLDYSQLPSGIPLFMGV
jgi:hypothetical protein